MKKLSILMAMMVLSGKVVCKYDFESGGLDYAMPTTSMSFGSEKPSSTSMEGNADRLLGLLYNDSDRGESVANLKETSSWLSKVPYWSNPATEKKSSESGGGLLYEPLSKKEMDVRLQKQRNAIAQAYSDHDGNYASDEEGLAALNADLKAVQDKIDMTKNPELRSKLEELQKFAKSVNQMMNQHLMKLNIDAKLGKLKPQATGSSLAESLMQADMQLNAAKAARDKSSELIYQEVIKRLQAIDAEVKMLKRQNNNSAPDALAKARTILQSNENDAKSAPVAQKMRLNVTIDLYREVVAQLEIEDAAETSLQSQAATVRSAASTRVVTNGNDARIAFTKAQEELGRLQQDLDMLRQQRRPMKEIQLKQDEKNNLEKILQELSVHAQTRQALEDRIDARIEELLRQNDGDMDEAFKQAQIVFQKSVNAFDKSVVTKISQQNEEDKKQREKYAKDTDIVNAFVDDKIAFVGGHPGDALTLVQDELKVLKDQLKLLKDRRSPVIAIKSKQDEVDKYQKGIEALMIKAKAAQVEDDMIAKRVDALLAKYDNDSALALKEAQLKVTPLRGPKSTSRIDLEVEKLLVEKDRKDAEERDKYALDLVSTRQAVKTKIGSDHPVQALAQAEEELANMQDELRRLQNLRNPMYANQIKIQQSNIELQRKVVEELTIEARKAEVEDQRVARKVEELVAKHGGDSKKASEEANLKITQSRGKPTKFDQDVAKALVKRVAEDKDYASKNNPLNIAIAKLNAALPAEVPQALEGVIAALLGKAGITMDTLDYGTRQNLANILKGSSSKLVIVMNDTRKTPAAKQQEKQGIVKAMIQDAGYLITQAKTGISKEAIQTGNLQVMALEGATNKFVDYLVGGAIGSGGTDYMADVNFDAGFSDPKSAAFETLGLKYGASIPEINKAYKALALKNHPDKGGDRNMFDNIQQAYETLNPDKRSY